MIHLRKAVKIVSAQGRQTLFVIPGHFVKQHPKDAVAEFNELDVDRLVMTLVQKDQNQNKAYELVHHNGATQVSIPRYWLQDRAAQSGDVVEVWEDTAQPDRILLRFVPKVSDPAKAASLLPPIYDSFRK